MDCEAEHLTAEYKNEEVGLYPNKPTSAGKSNRSENANSAAIAVGRTRLAAGWTRPDRLSVSPDYVFQQEICAAADYCNYQKYENDYHKHMVNSA